MATHSQNIQNLQDAVYGEQVRQSMIELFEEDYNLVSKGISIGTDISSGSSSTAGYYDGNVYLNTDTLDVWKLIGTSWQLAGNLKGIASITTVESLVDGGANVVTIQTTDGSTYSFNVLNGRTGAQGTSVTDAVDLGNGTFAFKLSNGRTTQSTVQAMQGIQGVQGDKGDTGATGKGVTSITSVDSGKNHVLTANFTDGTTNYVCTLRDGADGSSGGDMFKATYDANDNGIVDLAEGISDGVNAPLTYSALVNKAEKSTTLAGYGITDAYTKLKLTE